MRQIARIARTELTYLFHSPVAWFILVVFTAITLKDFFTAYNAYVEVLGQNPNATTGSLTSCIFSNGLCNKMIGTLFIYIPLLTMGLMARETSSGSIKLLESSPVTPSQIIFGKYLSILAIGLMMMVVPTVLAIFLGFKIENMDIALVVSNICGIYLLIMVYAAIGLFMSTTTSYQMVAALLSIIVLAALNYVGRLWQEIDAVREITYWLALPQRTGNFINGLVRLEDVIYFPLLSAMFLGFSIVLLRNKRHSYGIFRKALGYVCTAAVVCGCGYLSSRPWAAVQWDVTDSKVNSLTAESRKIISEIKEPVTVTEYVNLLDKASFQHLPINQKNSVSIVSQFMRYMPQLSLRHRYYYKLNSDHQGNPYFEGKNEEQLRDMCCMLYRTSPRMYAKADAMPDSMLLRSRNYSYCAVIETADGKRAIMHDFDDMEKYPSEAEFAVLLQSLISNPVQVAFLTGEGERPVVGSSERSMDSYTVQPGARYSLINKGFKVLGADIEGGSLPDSASIVVVADPAEAFSPKAMERLGSYINNGGNMLVLLDGSSTSTLAPLLGMLGLATDGSAISIDWDQYEQSLAVCRLTQPYMEISSAKPVMVTMTSAVNLEVVDTSRFRAVPMLETIRPAAGADGRKTTAYALESRTNPSQHIIVVADADCMSNAELSMSREGIQANNYGFIMDCFRYLTGYRYPMELPQPVCRDIHFRQKKS